MDRKCEQRKKKMFRRKPRKQSTRSTYLQIEESDVCGSIAMEQQSITRRHPIHARHHGFAHDGGARGGRARRPHFDHAIHVHRRHVRTGRRETHVSDRGRVLFVVLRERGDSRGIGSAVRFIHVYQCLKNKWNQKRTIIPGRNGYRLWRSRTNSLPAWPGRNGREQQQRQQQQGRPRSRRLQQQPSCIERSSIQRQPQHRSQRKTKDAAFRLASKIT